MSKQKFSPMALDDILKDALEDTQNLQNELVTSEENTEVTDDIIPAPIVNPAINNLINSNDAGKTVDYNRVYSQLERLIENGNIALQVLGAIDPDVSGVEIANATASLMNAVKNCVAEFTKIHMMHLKFEQQLKLMETKHNYKMIEMQQRKALYSDNSSVVNTGPVEMIEWETEGAMEYMKILQNRGK